MRRFHEPLDPEYRTKVDFIWSNDCNLKKDLSKFLFLHISNLHNTYLFRRFQSGRVAQLNNLI